MTGRSRLPFGIAVLAVTCVVVAAGLLTAPTPASAITKHELYPWFGFPRSPAYPNKECTGSNSRTVRTGPGKYRWRIWTWYSNRPDRKKVRTGFINLPRDLYGWEICWYPKGSNAVQVYSEIGHYTSGPSHERRLNAHIINGRSGTSGQYTVQSTLTRVGRMSR